MTDLEVKMNVKTVAGLRRRPEMQERLLGLARDGIPDDAIAAIPTRDGHSPPRRADKVLPITVGRLRRGAAIRVAVQRTRWNHDASLLSSAQLAAMLNIPVNWLYVQIRENRLLIDRQPNGRYLFPSKPAVLVAVRNLRKHAISQLDLRICQPHQERYQHG